MSRTLLPSLVVAVLAAVSASAAPLLEVTGRLDASAPKLEGGEFSRQYECPVPAGSVLTLDLVAEGFAPYLIAVCPDGREFDRAAPNGSSRARIQVVVTTAGTLRVMATSVQPGKQGPYRLSVTGSSLQGGLAGLHSVANKQGELTGSDRDLGNDRRYDTYTLEAQKGDVLRVVAESSAFDVYLAVNLANVPTLMADDVNGKNAEIALVMPAAGKVTLVVAAATAGGRGAYQLRVSSGKLGPALAPMAVATPATPSTRNTPTSPAEAVRQWAPPRPAINGTAPLKLDDPSLRADPPKPNPAIVDKPGILARTLHPMNMLTVHAGGWSEVREENLFYGKAQSPRNFHVYIHNQFADGPGGLTGTAPLRWDGNIFSCNFSRTTDTNGSFEALTVAGTVTPDASRVEWVSIRRYMQEVYVDPDGGEKWLAKREWSGLSLVDLPLRDLYSGKITTMEQAIRALPDQEILRRPYTFGYPDSPEAGSHVLELGYLLQDPARRGQRYIAADEIHSVSYQSTHWADPQHVPTARISFEHCDESRLMR